MAGGPPAGIVVPVIVGLLVLGREPGWPRAWPGVVGSEADRLPDEDDMDAAGQFLVDLQYLPHLAVLPVGGLHAGVLKLEAVLVDPLMRRWQVRDELLRDPGDRVGQRIRPEMRLTEPATMTTPNR
jgi:hypothetical protein